MTLPPRPLPPQAAERYARHLSLPGIGLRGQQKLNGASVLSIGAGGLGSPVIEYLAAAGVGCLGICDGDYVELSNLQRQVVHRSCDIGVPKVESAARRVQELNPEITVRTHPSALDATTVEEILNGYDIVVDGSDNFATRYLVADHCAEHDIPLVWGSIQQFGGQLSVFAEGYTLRDIFPTPPPPGSAPNCAEAGVFGVLPGVIGTMMATEVIKLITGFGTPLIGRLATWDAARSSFKTFSFAPNPDSAKLRHTPVADACDFAGAEQPNTEAEKVQSTTGFSSPHTSGGKDSMNPTHPAQPTDSSGQPEHRSMAELPVLLEEGMISVDVREPIEWEGGVLGDSLLAPLSQLRAGDLGPVAAVDRAQPVALYCKAGVRSEEAARILLAHGFERVITLDGGIMYWWLNHDTEQPSQQ
ncbi:putative adenylyltransferase/sulfurtransferase MoeZ [Corynebacterium ciconiae DSM 44920]|uniref:HesA/MoeB/ThiF family protein n=1 Tax=Corynebacterium ciconiae TaxID=227319 RepID=UPI000367721E|nr:HesA/MoeB/ThiF family protein [Corynebacterium ciconiae]WKD61779.1 putative adenylyltransferase/sulfurtransferase MoeZ [Corynebacterium ciconiae DSM 44920]